MVKVWFLGTCGALYCLVFKEGKTFIWEKQQYIHEHKAAWKSKLFILCLWLTTLKQNLQNVQIVRTFYYFFFKENYQAVKYNSSDLSVCMLYKQFQYYSVEYHKIWITMYSPYKKTFNIRKCCMCIIILGLVFITHHYYFGPTGANIDLHL